MSTGNILIGPANEFYRAWLLTAKAGQPYVEDGRGLQVAILGALYAAEVLAAAAGGSPLAPDGRPATIGAADVSHATFPAHARTLYFATRAAARALHASARTTALPMYARDARAFGFSERDVSLPGLPTQVTGLALDVSRAWYRGNHDASAPSTAPRVQASGAYALALVNASNAALRAATGATTPNLEAFEPLAKQESNRLYKKAGVALGSTAAAVAAVLVR